MQWFLRILNSLLKLISFVLKTFIFDVRKQPQNPEGLDSTTAAPGIHGEITRTSCLYLHVNRTELFLLHTSPSARHGSFASASLFHPPSACAIPLAPDFSLQQFLLPAKLLKTRLAWAGQGRDISSSTISLYATQWRYFPVVITLCNLITPSRTIGL